MNEMISSDARRLGQQAGLQMAATENGLTKLREAAMAYAFPDVDAGIEPFGSRVLVQIRRAKKQSAGGIQLLDETKDTEKWNTQIAKVVAYGPVAFRNRDTLTCWPEQAWCMPGDFVRVAKYGGDRWEVPMGKNEEPALFVIFNDLDLIGRVTGDPLAVKAFI